MALICFGLEGPLVDPLDGLADCLRQVCLELGIPCPDRQSIAHRMGGGPWELLPASLRPEASRRFLERFSEDGPFAQQVRGGVPLMLSRLKRQGQRMFVLSGQPRSCARMTLHHLDLLLLFDGVHGPGPGEPWFLSKRRILSRMAEEGILAGGGFLVGDTPEDLQAALASGLTPIGVAYGTGSREDLAAAGAGVVLDTVEALDAWLRNALVGPEIHDPFSRSE